MESESLKVQFFKQEVEKGIRDIFEAQLLIATRRIYQEGSNRQIRKREGRTVNGRSGVLKSALSNPEYKVTPQGNGLEAASTLPLYIRFLDMKEHGNYMIYNRQVYGILYSETRKNIKFGFRDWIEQNMGSMLQDLVKNQ